MIPIVPVIFTVDYSEAMYASIDEVFENHEQIIRGLARLDRITKDGATRTYYVTFEDSDGWTARGLAEQVKDELGEEGWTVEMKRESEA